MTSHEDHGLHRKQIIQLLETERSRIERAIAALSDGQSDQSVSGIAHPVIVSPVRRRRMSATARKRISEAQKKRWAARKKVSL
jgi:hypothetical protein